MGGCHPVAVRGVYGGKKNKAVTTDELLGFALGVLHLSYDDFCRLTPTQFYATCKAHNDVETALFQDRWEQVRLMIFHITLAPFRDPKKLRRMTPKKLQPFPWDTTKKTEFAKGDRDRMKEMFAKYGNSYKDNGGQKHD